MSDLWHSTLTFRRSSKVTDLDRPPNCLKCLNWCFWGFLRSLDWIYSSFFTWTRFSRVSSPFQISVRAFHSVCPRAMFRWGWRCFLPGCSYHTLQIFHQDTETTRHYLRNWMEKKRWWRFCFDTVNSFEIWTKSGEKTPISGKFDLGPL